MQALRSMFTRTPADKGASLQTTGAAQPLELSARQLMLVSGGLPRVSVMNTTSGASTVAEPPLPRVS